VQVATLASAEQALRVADVARVEVLQADVKLVLESLETTHLFTGFFDLPRVHFAHALHGAGGTLEAFPLADDGLDIPQTEAHVLETTDPADPDE